MIEVMLGEVTAPCVVLACVCQSLADAKEFKAAGAGFLNAGVMLNMVAAGETIERVSKALEMDSSEAAAKRLLHVVRGMIERHPPETLHASVTEAEVRELLSLTQHLQTTFGDQADAKFTLLLTKAERGLYEPSSPLFGDEVVMKLPEAARDIDEAGKCLALALPTATVFHLMRAMEIGLRALSDASGATLTKPSGEFLPWGAIVSEFKKVIDPLPHGARKDELTELHSLLWGVGKTWRNGTMHPAAVYTENEAKKIFEAVKGFMPHLALAI